FFFFSSRRRHTRFSRDWSSDVCSSDLDPARIPALVEEMLRLDPPLHLDMRKTTRDVTLGGVDVPAGSLVWLVIAAANRDPRAFRSEERRVGNECRARQ